MTEENVALFKKNFEHFYPHLKMGMLLFETVSNNTVILCKRHYRIIEYQHQTTAYQSIYSGVNISSILYSSNLYIKKVENGWKINILPIREDTYFNPFNITGHKESTQLENYNIDATSLTNDLLPLYKENIVLDKSNKIVKKYISMAKKDIIRLQEPLEKLLKAQPLEDASYLKFLV